jgi:two-component system chemotaxis response regulator CheY
MEGGDGLTFLKTIIQQHPDARVIIVSAIDDEKIRKQAFELGAVGYVSKPFQVNQILEQTQKALSN